MKKIYLSFLLLALFSFNCKVWHNFTTYFNLYYNTSLLYEEADELIKAERKNLFEFTEPAIPGSASQSVTKVIEKCSKILQFNQNSSYVEDALFMIGKCFYYQKNYPKALRKFNELIGKYPDGDVAFEAKLWIAKTNLQSKNFPNFLKLIEEVKSSSIENGEDEILVEAYVEQIKYLLYNERFPDAIKVCEELIENSSDDLINAQTMYQVGEIHYKLNDFSKAADAFAKVEDYSPSYDIELNSKVKLGKSISKIGKYQEALDIFIDLRDEDKNSESYDMIELEIGITYKLLEKWDNAYKQFLTVDTAYSSSVYAGAARFEMGDLFEKFVPNYDSASFYYQKSASSAAPLEYLTQIRTKNQQFTKYKSLSTSLINFQKQLVYLTDTTAFLKDSIAYAEELERLKKEQELTQNTELETTPGRERDFGDDPNKNNQVDVSSLKPSISQPIRPTLTADSLKSLIIKNSYDLGNLFFTEINQLDSAKFYYSFIVDSFNTAPIVPQALFALGSYYLTIENKQTADSIFNFIYENYPNDKIVNAAASKINKPIIDFDKDPAKDEYLIAEKLMSNEKYDSSYNKFYNIYLKHPNSQYAPKSLLAAGWILENKLSQNEKAVTVYDSLINNYPKSQYALNVASKLAFYKQEKTRIEKEIKDSLKRIEDEKIRIRLEDSLKTATKLDSIKNSNQKLAIPDSITNTKEQLPPDSLMKEKGINPFEKQIPEEKTEEKIEEIPEENKEPEKENPKLSFDMNMKFIYSKKAYFFNSIMSKV